MLKILRVISKTDDTINIFAQAVIRFHYVKDIVKGGFPHWQVNYEYEENQPVTNEIKAFTMAIINSVKELIKINPMFQEQMRLALSQIGLEKPGLLMDLVASFLKDLKTARKILDEQHYGLDDVKQRILEFMSTIVKRGKVSGSIICLVGPPGKTSIGKSIADAMGRRFYRFSVGGMRDEAEIKGHRRTYIGAMPGKFIQSLKRSGVENPVIMLDEIDKIGANYQGDPAAALLEVLDPEQNSEFLDHYLDVRFDLSNILFVTTANQLDTIPRPLLDGMEIIKLSGYILEEKVEIAKSYLVPKQRKEHGLKANEVSISGAALKKMIDGYAREAGIRGLENQIKK